MTFSIGSPGRPAQSKLAEPLLSPSTIPWRAHSCLARERDAQRVGQFLDLPRLPHLAEVHEQRRRTADSQTRREHRKQPLHVGLRGQRQRRLGAIMVKAGIEQALHSVRDRQGDSPQIATPFELAHEAAADGH